MARSYKCPLCKKSVSEGGIPFQNRHWHPNCLQEYKQKKKLKEEVRQEIKMSANSDPDYKDLVQYILKLFSIDELTGMIRYQIDKYHEYFGMKYKGMKFSLVYYYELQDNKPDLKYGIGIVPIVYDQAKQFYIAKRKLNKSAKDGFAQERQIIKVGIPKRNDRSKHMIDISKI